MIGHESIHSGDDIRCRCGHILVPALGVPSETYWTSDYSPGSFQAHVEQLYDAHIAELEAGRLYGFDGDEYLQNSPEAVYERWADDWGYQPDGMLFPGADRPERLEIIEWSVVDVDTQIPRADWLLETIAEHIADECGYTEAYEAADRACKHPDVVEACEKLRSEIAAHFTGWLSADQRLRTLIVTWDDDHQPLLDGRPMYVKRNK